MASEIQGYLENILSASYGREVRQSIHDAIEECYENVSTARTNAETAIENVNTARERANTAASSAETQAAAAEAAAESATTAAGNVRAAITAANSAASTATSQASAAEQMAARAERKAADADAAAQNAEASTRNVESVIAELNTVKTEMETAMTAANEAADTATTAADTADSATARANAAAQMIDDLSTDISSMQTNLSNLETEVNSFSQNISGTLSSVNQAVSDVNAATKNINDLTPKVTDLQQKIDDATTAISNANDKANFANEKATLADSMATEASGAASIATSQATAAQTAAGNANTARQRAEEAAIAIEGMTVHANSVSYDRGASAEISTVNNHKDIVFYIPEGQPGKNFVIKGIAYATKDDLEVSVMNPEIGDMYNVGAAPPYHVYRYTGTIWEDQGAIGIVIENVSNSDVDAMWTGNNPSGATRYLSNDTLYYLISNKIKSELGNKVNIETKTSGTGNKVLSDNNLTDALMATWNGMADRISAVETGKVNVDGNKVLSDVNFTLADATKLRNSITVTNNLVTNIPKDSAFSTSSTNPVQNNIVTTRFNTLEGTVSGLSSASTAYGENFADTYDSSSTYAIGDVCVYNGSVYQCNTIIRTPEAFNANHWTKINLTSLIDSLSEASLKRNGSNGVLNPVTNLNDFRNGIGLFNSSSCTNCPTGKSGAATLAVVIAMGATAESSNNIVQIAFSLNGNDNATSFLPKTRRCVNGTWSAWQEFSGQHFNDLMALDGKHVANTTALKNFDEFYTGIIMFQTSSTQPAVYTTLAANSTTGLATDNRPWGSSAHTGMLISVASTPTASGGSGSSTYTMNETSDVSALSNGSNTPNYCLQFVFDLAGTSTPRRRTMTLVSGVRKWSPWVDIDQADLANIVPSIDVNGLIRQDGTAGYIRPATADADTFLNGLTLFASGSTAAAHLPSADSWAILAGGNTGTIVQYALPMTAGGNSKSNGWTHSGTTISGQVSNTPKRRSCVSGTWTEWVDASADMHAITYDVMSHTLTSNEQTQFMTNTGLGNVATLVYDIVSEPAVIVESPT